MIQSTHKQFLVGATTPEALTRFDSLLPVPLDFMLGRWRGWEIATGHPIEGLLDAMGWYGKEFINENAVQPLLAKGARGAIFPIAPTPLIMKLAMRLPLVRVPLLRPINRAATRLLKTRTTQARLRMVAYRGVASATMIYDHLPIHDHFRKVDEDTVLGLMDYKLVPQPYFFMLVREGS